MIEEGDDSFVWAVTITSPEAQAIRLHIENFSLPENAELFLLGADGQADGPHVGRGRNDSGDFWTRSIGGDTGTIVVRYSGARPDINKARTTFGITELGHIRGRRPRPELQSHNSWPCSDNAACVQDALCPATNPVVNDAKAAVAKLEWIRGPFINTCTGGLIADKAPGTIPFMLSANHCFSRNINNLETFFNYTTSSCNGPCPDSLVTGGTPLSADTVGMTVNATNRDSDYTLFTLNMLNGSLPAGALFLGWNSAPVANNNGSDLFRISNANFGPQVYSEHSVVTDSPTCNGLPRGPFIYSEDTFGATMGGSSGSPVVNSAGEIVGQLFGCCGYNCGDVCDSGSNWTVDGAFANYFSEVASILDPAGGCTTDAECDDGLFCTGAETCVSGSCQSGGDPCLAGDSCNEGSDTCESDPGCTSDAECNDGLFCTGTETCFGGSCESSGDPCGTGVSCDEGSNECFTCGANKASCSVDLDCCSANCKRGTCRGN